MINCCNLCKTLVLAFAALLLSTGSLQAQSQANCDLSKCSPEERAECAKRCASNTSSLASLTSFLFAETTIEKKTCNPADCKKISATTATAKLVSTETKVATSYGDNLEEKITEVAAKSSKKCCATKCSKAKVSL